MKNNLIIISGTTKGLGKSLKNEYRICHNVLCINRKLSSDYDIKIDLSEKTIDLTELKEEIAKYDKVIFISNASTIEPITDINNISESDIENSIYLNYINPSKIVLSIIKSRKEFVILNITSGAAFTSNTMLALYSASKASMHRFIEILKVEEKNNKKALLIENFDPGRMQTSMQDNLIKSKKLKNKTSEFNLPKDVVVKIDNLIGKYL